MLKKYIITVEVYSPTLSLMEISEFFEEEPSAISFNLGEKRFRERRWEISAWKKDLGEFDELSIEQAWGKTGRAICSMSPSFESLSKSCKDVFGKLVIGVIVDGPASTVDVPADLVKACAGVGIGVSVSVYHST